MTMIKIIKFILSVIGLTLFALFASILFSMFKALYFVFGILFAIFVFSIIMYNVIFKDDDD